MIGSVLFGASFSNWLVIAGAVLIVGGSVVSGYRFHYWVDTLFPAVGRYIPRDAGAWLGLAFGVATLFLFY